MADEFTAIPEWRSGDAVGAAVAGGDLVVLATGRYRVGRALGAEGWSPWHDVPGWRDDATAAGLALTDLDGARAAVVLAGSRYRIGRGLADDGAVTGGWSRWRAIPEPPGEGGDVAVADLDGRPALIAVIAGRYRVGFGLGADGAVDRWSEWTAIPDWRPAADVGAAVSDLDGDGRPELLVLSGGAHTVGWGLDTAGRAADGWGLWTELPDWPDEPFVSATFAGSDLVAVAGGSFRAAPPELDVAQAPERGVWRILDFDSQILAVHAALLHTGDVLFFAGSGADRADHEAHRYRTRVWHYPSARFTAPRTPIDLFCAGQAFLAGGRLLAAGGTSRYGPFRGLRDALTFNPQTLKWSRVRKMLRARWYPTLLTFGDGRVISVSGRGADGAIDRVPEVFESGHGWRNLPSPGLLPWYAHLFLLADGRVFYSGGQMSGNRGAKPQIWKPADGRPAIVQGLPAADLRNQATSVLLGTAQDQRVMIIGGGGADIHEHGDDDEDHHPHERAPHVATDSVAIADLSAAEPRYRRAASLQHARMHLNGTLLPDRTVLANGGARVEEHRVEAALHAELYDPRTGRWTEGARSRVPRLYHSIALLTPDGRVITAGSNPRPRDDELRIEVYLPPYLFRGARPRLELSRDHARHGARLAATSPDAGRLREVNLMRPGAVTHAFNNDQRLLDLPFEVTGPERIRLQLPRRRTLAPGGWYMVFAVDTDGVPSVGRWLRLG
jgi:hypothetical protein